MVAASIWPWASPAQIGSEKSIARHLSDGEEFEVDLPTLLRHGESIFSAAWTVQEGAGYPSTKGTGAPLSNPASPLQFPRNFNRISAPDANSCLGCHSVPRIGGGGDIVANVFVLGQRFDFATFDSMMAGSPAGRGMNLDTRLPSRRSQTNEPPSACSAPAILRCWRAR